MDKIIIQELRVETKIGVYPREKMATQTIEIDLEVALPARSSYLSDKIADTIDYDALVKYIYATLENHHFGLLENLAEHIAQGVMKKFSSPGVRISVTKLGVLPKIKKISVVLKRGNIE